VIPGLDYQAGMKTAKDLQPLVKRERDLAKRRAELEQALAEVSRLESELAITKRTIADTYGIKLDAGSQPVSTKTKGKPKDIPSIHEMASVLFQASGQEWLETQEIVRLIKEKWWPSADRNDIAPTLWRLQKDGKLRKHGTKYALPSAKEPLG
jgi:hypothetical protein